MKTSNPGGTQMPGGATHPVSKSLWTFYNFLRDGWVKWLRRKTENFSRRAWIITLIGFATCGVTGSAYKISSVFCGNTMPVIKITAISKPRQVIQSGDPVAGGAKVPVGGIKEIDQFLDCLDSMDTNAMEPAEYDSHTSIYPGMPDTVFFGKRLYHQ